MEVRSTWYWSAAKSHSWLGVASAPGTRYGQAFRLTPPAGETRVFGVVNNIELTCSQL
jgi:hypothetical protein